MRRTLAGPAGSKWTKRTTDFDAGLSYQNQPLPRSQTPPSVIPSKQPSKPSKNTTVSKYTEAIRRIQKLGEAHKHSVEERRKNNKGNTKSETSASDDSDLSDLIKFNASVPPALLKGGKRKLRVLWSLETGSDPTVVQRQAFDLAIVLDRSGSMAGDPLDNSKAAVKEIISNLRSNDCLHFVVYDDNSQVIFTEGTKSQKMGLQAQVDGVKTAGCTNLCDGILDGFEVLMTDSKTPGVSRPLGNKRIFVFSDGQVNSGITEKSQIWNLVKEMHKFGVQTTAFGLGASFDEKLMKSIAEHGRGNYFFIDGAADVKDKVAKGMEVLCSLLATNSRLKIRTKPGVQLTKVYGLPLAAEFPIGDLCEDDLRTVLMEFEVDTDNVEGDVLDCLDYEMSLELVTGPESTEQRVCTGNLQVKLTDSKEEAEKQNEELLVAQTIAECTEKEEEVLSLLEANKWDKAIEIKQGIIASLKRVEKIDKTRLVGLLLEQSQAALKDMKSDKDRSLVKKQVGYTYHRGGGGGIVHRKCF